ncbi:MAG: hypothetical protein AB8B79_08200 [Granulosicoccus sp.]
MKTKYTWLTGLALSATLVACSSSDSPTVAANQNGSTSAGTTDGDTGAGTTGGDTGAGTTGGDTGAGTTGGGTGTGGITLTDGTQFLGILDVTETTSSDEVEISGFFVGFSSSVLGSVLQTGLMPTLDTCTVEAIDITDTDVGLPGNLAVDFNTVSAGEVIPFISASGTYAELVRENQFGFDFYVSDPETISGSIPSQLTASIPGDVFPAFPSISIPVVERLIVSSPVSGSLVTPGTTFTWTPGTNPDAFITISAFSGFGTDAIDVDCEVRDDGQFAFSAATQAEMGAGFSSIFTDLERVVFAIQQQGNAALFITTSSTP